MQVNRILSALPAVVVGALFATFAFAGTITNVTTYHNDNYRTGWNNAETVLTPTKVSGTNFNLRKTVALDDQVDAQPLYVENQSISGKGTHNVVYVATESNSIYAIDGTSGAVLLHASLGSPVPYTSLPGWCNNNGANVGIGSTPVIDTTAGTMYVVTYTMEGGNQTYRIHALDLSTLTDKVPSVVITASGKLTNGQTFNFDPTAGRQRAALLLSNGNVYAGFASFCDYNANTSRGWLLGWQTNTLTPLPANHLNNTRATSPDTFFLTSIWMSGYGLAADPAGDIFFATGNSDPSATTYNAVTNLSESIVKLSSDLTTVEGHFSPPAGYNDVEDLDAEDGDFGSGGVMLLPPQTGSMPDLATALGKAGILYLLDADDLGKNKNGAYVQYPGGCWCGESYFQDNMGHPYVITSAGWGGSSIDLYRLDTHSAGTPSLSLEWATNSIAPNYYTVPNGQNAGVFTSLSSNDGKPSSLVIWSVSHPTDSNPSDIYLYAFDVNGNNLIPGGSGLLAGTWPNIYGDANIVPTVANGKVYVASYQTLSIFGIGAGTPASLPKVTAVAMRAPLAAGERQISGMVERMTGNLITVACRGGRTVTVDSTLAAKNYRMAQASVGHALLARGTIDGSGVLHAMSIQHAFQNAKMWMPDR
ncbi:MAG: hypothetical protein ABSC92_15415 [Rhizomicrobium sp.]|jgi:hypothetical protein